MIRAGGMEVALLRRTGRRAEARARLASLAVGRPAELLPATRGGAPRRRGRGAVDAPRGGPRAGARAGRRLHGARPLGRRARAARAPLPVGRRGGRAGDGPAPGLPARRLLPRLLRREGGPLRPGGLRRSPRASPPATSSRTVPSLSSSSAGPWRRTRRTPPPTSSSARSSSPAGSPTRRSPSGRRRARSTRRSPSSTATSASPSSTRAARREDALRVFDEGMAADPDERRALPGGRPGAEPARPRGRGADRVAAPVPRDAPALDARLQAGARARRGGALRRGGGALPRALLPARGVRHERAAGLPRGGAAPRPSPSRARGGRPRRRRSRRPSASPSPGFDFTKDGMKAFVDAPRFQYYCGELQALLGDDAAAREHWSARGRRPRLPADGLRVPRGAEARRGERGRVAPAARDGARRGRPVPLPRRPLPGGRHLRPRACCCARSAARPRANEALRQVFVLPDKGMPHHIARLALQEP